jgi:hypothetical protein
MRGWIWVGGGTALIAGAGYALVASLAPLTLGYVDGAQILRVADGWRILQAIWWQVLLLSLAPGLVVGLFLSFSVHNSIKSKIEADLKAKAEELSQKEERLVREADVAHQLKLERLDEIAKAQRRADALMARAEETEKRAEIALLKAKQEVEHWQLRSRNAIAAAERIKRKIEGKKRVDIH